jgi:DNA polymerase-3 subunit delta'
MKEFFGNAGVVETLEQMIEQRRIPQTLLFGGPEGIGKATLARRFAACLLGHAEKIEQDDLSLPHNQSLLGEREKWPADKRNEDPLLFATHPDFVTFAPDGPLRQVSIPQMRLLRERAQYKPLAGKYRVFLIDQIDRANEQAANSILKTLEEPPDHLVLIMTAANTYDLLPTIRSRAVPFYLTPLGDEEMRRFCASRVAGDVDRRIALAAGSPGAAISIDLDAYERRRTAMLALLESASGRTPFSSWARFSESIGQNRSEKLEHYLKALYLLLGDVLAARHGYPHIRNIDLRAQLESLAAAVSFEWIAAAVRKVDELNEFLRRNIQKGIALDALVMELREFAPGR